MNITDKLKTYLLMISAVVILALIITVGINKYTIATLNENIVTLNDTIDKLKVSKALEEANNISLKAKINEQNSTILANEVDIENKTKAFNEYMAKSDKLKYPEVHKYKGVNSDECDKIKNILDDIGNGSL